MATLEKATAGSGNTRLTQSKARDWQLTLNDVSLYEDLKGYLRSRSGLRYLISCREKAPTTGHEHIHIYVQYSKPLVFSLKKTCGAHIEKCYGTPQQNVDYIKKDGQVIDEEGSLHRAGGYHTMGELEEEDSSDVPPMYYNVYRRRKDEARPFTKASVYKPDIEVYYLWGPSGAGKTKTVMEMLGDDEEFDMVKFENGFYEGVSGKCTTAVYDDFRDSHMKASEFVNFIDYNVHWMNVKGGAKRNDYKRIFITSVQPLDHIYSGMGDEPRRQWVRRVKEIPVEDPLLDSTAGL